MKYTFILKCNLQTPIYKRGYYYGCPDEHLIRISFFLFPSQKEEDNFLLNEEVTRVEIQNLKEVYEKIVRWLRMMFKEIGSGYRSDGSKEITYITGKEFTLYTKQSGIEAMLVRIVHLGYFIERAIKENEKVYFVKVPDGTTMETMLEV
ncbi:MAG: hypothetical protein EAZ85_09990 [Bacteroidetes bacterium]|nr:MAG: hypothetical protein EAZ85_09990 [Bacteroidota bacterium]TAG91936.1 MAG: hypothetical protein EAZ20_02920 [Bacteroidota bacterium]